MFEVLGKASVSVRPCKGALDNPKALYTAGALDDLDGPVAYSGNRRVIPRNNLAALHIAKLSPSPSGMEGPVPLHGVGVGHIGLRNADRPHPLPLP